MTYLESIHNIRDVDRSPLCHAPEGKRVARYPIGLFQLWWASGNVLASCADRHQESVHWNSSAQNAHRVFPAASMMLRRAIIEPRECFSTPRWKQWNKSKCHIDASSHAKFPGTSAARGPHLKQQKEKNTSKGNGFPYSTHDLRFEHGNLPPLCLKTNRQNLGFRILGNVCMYVCMYVCIYTCMYVGLYVCRVWKCIQIAFWQFQ